MQQTLGCLYILCLVNGVCVFILQQIVSITSP